MGETISSRQETAAAQPAVRESRLRSLNQWLANPLLVTVVAALLVNWLIPQLTRKWQDHQKALEIKTGLVSDMSESVASAVSTGRFVASGLIAEASADPRATQRAWNDGYRDWTTRSSSIGARLETYLPNDTGAEWRTFANVVTDFLLVSTRVDETKLSRSRLAQVGEIFAYRNELHLRLKRQDWLTLARRYRGDRFQQAYASVAQGILARRDELVARVLKSAVAGF
jgi:hypothetical protein